MGELSTLCEEFAGSGNDGDSVALEGFTHLMPTVAAHEIVRQGRRDLTLGGAPEIAASAREVIMVLRQRPRSFVETLNFVTSVGYREGGDTRADLGYPGAGPTAVITDLGPS